MLRQLNIIEQTLKDNTAAGLVEIGESIRETPEETKRLMQLVADLLPIVDANTVAYYERHRVLGEQIRAQRAADAAKVNEQAKA
jgi:hypothetical protein